MATMRELFCHHHRLTDNERDTLLKKCYFALDANVLLNIYRYADVTRADLLQVLRALKSRLWVPYQAANEFYRNRIKIIGEQRDKFKELTQQLDQLLTSITDSPFKRSGFLRVDAIEQMLRPAVEQAKKHIDAERAKHPDLIRYDPYLEELVGIVGESVGRPLEDEQFELRSAEAQRRIDRKQPPGYRDGSKSDSDRRNGDVLIWFELLDLAEQVKTPIVFVTEDEKDDWWHTVNGEKLGARPELRKEMRERAAVDFYLCKPAFLLEVVGPTLSVKVADSSIDNAKQIAVESRVQAHNISRVLSDWTSTNDIFLNAEAAKAEFQAAANHAVAMWLTSKPGAAEILPEHDAGFDFTVVGKEGDRTGVVTRFMRHLPPELLTVHATESALSTFYGWSGQKIDRLLLVFVARDRRIALTIANTLGNRLVHNPRVQISVGSLRSDDTYEELVELPEMGNLWQQQ